MKRSLIAILILMIIQLILCVPFINSYPIDLDEPFSIFNAQKSLEELSQIFINENNPPLHFYLLHYWMKWFGMSPWSVRGLSLVFSVFTIPVLFDLSKRIFKETNWAILTSLFFIFSNFIHYHSIEARTYSLFVLLFVIILRNIYLLIFENKSQWLVLGITNGLLLYTHYLGMYILVTEIGMLLFFFKRLNIKLILKTALAFIITTVIYYPGLKLFITRLKEVNEGGTWVSAPHWSELYGNIFRFMNLPFSFVSFTALMILFYFLNKIQWKELFKRYFKTPQYQYLYFYFGFTYFGMFIISYLYQAVFLDRYLLYTTPILYLILTVLAKELFEQKNKTIWGLTFVLPFVVTFNLIPNSNREGDKMAEYVTENRKENSLVVMCPPFYDLTFMYHYRLDVFKNYQNFYESEKRVGVQGIYSYNDINVNDSIHQIIFVDANSNFLFPENDIYTQLNEHFKMVKEKPFAGDYHIYIFEK